MLKQLFITTALATLCLHPTHAVTHRTPQFENNKVSVWKTTIYPTEPQKLTLHRHDNDRVLIAFTNGTLKITDNKGHVKYLTLEKNKAYYLTKEPQGEQHTDENRGKEPIEVIVIELKG